MSSPSGQLAAALPLVEHLDEAAQRGRAVLEEVVDVRDAVRRVRVARADDHRAAGLVEDDDVTLDALQELVERREDAAAGARPVARGDALRLRDELPRGRRLHVQPAGLGHRRDVDEAARRLRPRERRQPGAAGWIRRIARDDAVVVEQLRHRPVAGRVEGEPEERVRVLEREVAAAEPVDARDAHGVVGGIVLQRRLHLVREVAAVGAVRVGPVADDDRAHAAERFAQLAGREGAEDVRAEHARAHACAAEKVGCVLCRLRGRVQQEERNLRVVHQVAVDEIVVPPAQLLVLGEDAGDCIERRLHREVLLVLVVDEVGVVHVRPDGHRVPRVENGDRLLERAEEVAHDLGIFERVHAPLLVAREEAVERDDCRQPDVRPLGDAKRADVQVVDRLRVARHEDEPAGVERVIDVRVVAADVERAAHRARREVEEHREPRPGLHGVLLEPVQQALRARRVEDASAADRRAVADAGRAVLAVGGDHHHRVMALGLSLVEDLRDLRRRRDRVVAHQVEVDVLGRERRHLVAGEEARHLCRLRALDGDRHDQTTSAKSGTVCSAAQPGSSRISTIAPVGHTSTHLRQPLQ